MLLVVMVMMNNVHRVWSKPKECQTDSVCVSASGGMTRSIDTQRIHFVKWPLDVVPSDNGNNVVVVVAVVCLLMHSESSSLHSTSNNL